MRYGFHLYIDEAGDEGLDRVRPIDPNGGSEYFVLCGVLIRAHREHELQEFVVDARLRMGLRSGEEIHFRKLSNEQQNFVLTEIADFPVGIVAVVSNKRNMRLHRNHRVDAKMFEVVRGRRKPQNVNWFYNSTFRYLLERASAECARWSIKAYREHLPIQVIFARRSGFRYSQTQAYLHLLRMQRHRKTRYNNKRQIDWRVVDPSAIKAVRASAHAGLQVADCVASAIYRAIDEDQFGVVEPRFLEVLATRFIQQNGSPRDHGFALFPSGFSGPLSAAQRRSLRAVGYEFDWYHELDGLPD